MAVSSLPHQLRLLRHSCSDSFMFYHQSTLGNRASDQQPKKNTQSSPHFFTYRQCWEIVTDHQRWLQATINEQHRIIATDGGVFPTSTTEIKDVVIGYLGDNSPDLLLSVLACMHLTTDVIAGSRAVSSLSPHAKLLPAMINGRWTPLEIDRALRPRFTNDAKKGDGGGSNDVHVTILLYGSGYESAAKEAVRLMNLAKKKQTENGTAHSYAASCFAVTLSLPQISVEYYNASLDSRGGMRNGDSSDQEVNPQSNHNIHDLESTTSNADALLLFTSGTSSPNGSAKGVRLSHRSLLVQAQAKTRNPCRYDCQTKVVATTVPWWHVGGMNSALAVILCGGCLVFHRVIEEEVVRKGSFQPKRVLQAIRPSHSGGKDDQSSVVAANTLVVVPAMLHAIADYVQRNSTMSPTVFPNVKLILVGGQSIGNGRLYEQTRQIFPKTRIVQTYACTEAGSSITFEDLGWRIGNGKDKNSDSNDTKNRLDVASTCVGTPPPHVRIGIFDSTTHASDSTSTINDTKLAPPTLVPHGTIGIIGTCGAHIMSGYWNRGGIDKDDPIGWMLTNDLGYIHPQSGKLFFCGRANDVIRTGGESVLATEVEHILRTNGDIADCAVFALPDEKFGEVICAAIVLKEPPKATRGAAVAIKEDKDWTQRARQYCAGHQLAGFKQPRRVFCVQALPRNSSGKLLKHTIFRECASQSKHKSRL